jgi:hypothetical protein
LKEGQPCCMACSFTTNLQCCLQQLERHSAYAMCMLAAIGGATVQQRSSTLSTVPCTITAPHPSATFHHCPTPFHHLPSLNSTLSPELDL